MKLPESLIKKLKTDSNFVTFLEYVIFKINELDTVEGLRSLSYEMAGQEAMVRDIAKNKLYEIIEPVVTYEELASVNEEKLARKKAQYGIID
jgi:hypothetical protein